MKSASVLRAELRSEIHSVRFRVLATLLVFMAVGLLVSGAVTHAAQLKSLNDRVNAELQLPSKNLNTLVKRGRRNSGGASRLAEELFTTYPALRGARGLRVA